MNRFRFVPNIPQVVSLASQEEDIDSDTLETSYPLSDGRTLLLGRSDATRLNLLDLRPGETFGLCRRFQDERMIATDLDIWLTPATEQARAAAEQQRQQPEISRKPVTRRRKVQEIAPAPQTASQPAQGNGTYGPAPQPRPALATATTARIPWNIAFREVAAFVAQELKQIGEQWSDQARQDAVSTILIAEAKAGRITTWER